MRAQATLALIALLASGGAAAEDRFATPAGARGPAAAALYVAVPVGARHRKAAGPTLGLRIQELPVAPLSAATLHAGWRPQTILDVPLRLRRDDPLEESGAARLLGKGLIVGIVVGAIVAVSVISDDDDDGDGGY